MNSNYEELYKKVLRNNQSLSDRYKNLQKQNNIMAKALKEITVNRRSINTYVPVKSQFKMYEIAIKALRDVGIYK